MLNASDGVLRATARPRPALIRSATARRLHRTSVRAARRAADIAIGLPASATARMRKRRGVVLRRHVLLRLTSERTVPLAVAILVLLAGAISLGPSIVRPVGAAQDPQPIRLAIGGGVTGAQPDSPEIDQLLGVDPGASSLGSSVDDGTLYKPVAVDTSVESGSDLLRHYTVRKGDSLGGIAARFHVSMMTVWWANHLTSKDQLHIGEVLVIPPVNGLIITVQVGDTIDALAAKYKTTSDEIMAVNELTDPNLIVGQVLVVPGAKGAPIPTPKVATVASGSGGHGSFAYSGGTWHWPVVGGGNYISQNFWSGHPGIDIAAQYGTPIVAPLAARVVYAGWKDNGGGYQVWLNFGNGLYSGMYHMSSVSVSVGQVVARGQQVGRIGMSGWATGPHVHFEVWIGYPWESSSYRVNPLRYY